MPNDVNIIKQSGLSVEDEIKVAKCSVLALDIAIQTCDQVRKQFDEQGKGSLARQYGIAIDHLTKMKDGYVKYKENLEANNSKED